MKSSSVLSQGPVNLFSMEKGEVSKTLYSQVQWEELLRSGVFLQHKDHQLLERAQSNLGVILDSPSDAQEYAKMLIKIAENCTTNLTVQQYVFTRIEEILGLGIDATDSDSDAFGIKHAHLFTIPSTNPMDVGTNKRQLTDNCFARAISFADIYLQKSSSLAYATLLTAYDGNMMALVNWMNSKFASTTLGVWDIALPALGVLTRNAMARSYLMKSNIIPSLIGILKRVGVVNANSQHLYELIFVFWSLSLTETDPKPYLSSGIIPILLDVLAAASTKKVTRITIFTLKNLASWENDKILNEMYSSGLLRLLDNLSGSNSIKQMHDIDCEADFKFLLDCLAKNYRELSSFDRLASEINSGALRWGILHKEKFWKENAKFLEMNDFALVKALLALIHSSDTTVTCIALYDLGEFVRFYPNGRVVVSRLGGKETIMKLISSDDNNIQRHALQCISKIMVSNWEHLK